MGKELQLTDKVSSVLSCPIVGGKMDQPFGGRWNSQNESIQVYNINLLLDKEI